MGHLWGISGILLLCFPTGWCNLQEERDKIVAMTVIGIFTVEAIILTIRTLIQEMSITSGKEA